MLVLKRKIGESLIIGDNIEVTILDKEGDTIKLGIRAPRTVRVYRQEIFEEIKKANQGALQTPSLQQLQNMMKREEK